MSPRRAKRRIEGSSTGAGPANERIEEWPDGEWVVRSLTGSASTKTYRCPGCDQEIRPATPHVVAWPVHDSDARDRRHWHTACWKARDRRSRK